MLPVNAREAALSVISEAGYVAVAPPENLTDLLEQ